jgi:hypothetical protein
MWDDVEDETPAQPEPEPEPVADAAAEAEAPKEEAEPPAPEIVVKGYEPRKLVFKHWIRWVSQFFQTTNIQTYKFTMGIII